MHGLAHHVNLLLNMEFSFHAENGKFDVAEMYGKLSTMQCVHETNNDDESDEGIVCRNLGKKEMGEVLAPEGNDDDDDADFVGAWIESQAAVHAVSLEEHHVSGDVVKIFMSLREKGEMFEIS